MKYLELVMELSQDIRESYENGYIENIDDFNYCFSEYEALYRDLIVGACIQHYGLIYEEKIIGLDSYFDLYLDSFDNDVYEKVKDIETELNNK